MKTFATKKKQSAPALRKARSYVHHPMGPVQLAQQAEVRRILHSTGAQAKLTIGQPNDKYEQEADLVADQVMAMPDPKLQRQSENEEEEETLQTKPLADQITPLVQRQEESEEEEEPIQTKLIQRQPDNEEEDVDELAQTKPIGDRMFAGSETLVQPKGAGAQTPQVSPTVAANIQALKGGGRPLPQATRSYFEPRLGAAFSGVRVHTSARAAETAQSINARAFTVGRNIVFGANQYAPESHAGRRLLAHELAHVVQQNGSKLQRGPRRASGVNSSGLVRRGLGQGGHMAQQASAPTATAPKVQCRVLFGPGTGAPKDWSTKVKQATTSGKKAALVQQATGVTTVDVTAKTSGDAKVDKNKLVPYSASSQKVNYDDGLNSKKSINGRKLTRNAGYMITSTKNYVVLGPKALDGRRFYHTRRILSHEFDHVRQAATGRRLKMNELELDAWTTSFIRDFHRSYVLGKSGTGCYIYSYPSWNPLLEYYVRKNVRAAARDKAIDRFKRYYNARIKPHVAHALVFRSWVHKRIKTAGPKFDDLPVRLDKELRLNAGRTATLPARFKCSTLGRLTYPSAPTVAKP